MSQIAYSYQRYSSPAQESGDSIRRQTELARKWCEKNGYTLDTATTYADRGVSGYRGKHRETGMLRRFLDDVEQGHIPRGAVLLLENMDRLSREKPVVGVNVLTGLLMAGVRVVQLAPEEIEFTEDSDLFTLFRGQLSQARGHDESSMKTRRGSEKWRERQRAAREDGARVTARLPGWLEIRGGRLVKTARGGAKVEGGTIAVVPERATVVREIFKLATEGHGLALIVKALTERKVGAWGRGGAWSKAYVFKILTGRAVLGEYQPKKDDKPDGPPIANYFPAVVDEETWLRAQAALAQRKGKPGRVGKKPVVLFSGLLREPGDAGERILVVNQTRGAGTKNRQKRRVLVAAGGMEGRKRAVSFPLDVFEESLRACLREIDPAEVLGGQPEGKSQALAAELRKVKDSMAALVADLDANGDSPAVLKRLRAKESEHARLTRELATARMEEKHPKAAALTEAQTLLDLPDDERTRLRLRQLIRETVAEVRVAVAPGPACRVALVQVFFDTDSVRTFLIGYRPARRGVKGETFKPFSLVQPGGGERFDLSRAEDAAVAAELLPEMAKGAAEAKGEFPLAEAITAANVADLRRIIHGQKRQKRTGAALELFLRMLVIGDSP